MAADDLAPGQHSIEAAFRAVYGTQEPERRAPPADQRPPAPGAALDAINAYRGEDHWHLVTLGLTDLAGPSSGSQISGLGHELTLLTPPAEHAPEWAFALLLGVARTVRAVGRPLHAGARLAPGAPLDGAASGLVALGIREDPLVAPTSFAMGHFVLLQLVGVTAGEHGVMGKVGTAIVLAKLAERDALLRTDPSRA